jgi:hypothetical protein
MIYLPPTDKVGGPTSFLEFQLISTEVTVALSLEEDLE